MNLEIEIIEHDPSWGADHYVAANYNAWKASPTIGYWLTAMQSIYGEPASKAA
jgi:hypothetical protein